MVYHNYNVVLFLVPVFQVFRDSIKKPIIKLITLTILSVLAVVLIKFDIVTLLYFCVFLFGYIISDLKLDKYINMITTIVIVIISSLVQIGRLLLRNKIDGTMDYTAYSFFSHFILGISIFVVVFELFKIFPKLSTVVNNSKLINWFDKYSFYLYLAHGLFFTGRFNVYGYFDNILISTIVFVVLTMAVAVVIKLITDLIYKVLDKILKI